MKISKRQLGRMIREQAGLTAPPDSEIITAAEVARDTMYEAAEELEAMAFNSGSPPPNPKIIEMLRQDADQLELLVLGFLERL